MRVRGAGVELATRVDGPRHGPVLVIAHGVGSSARFVREAFAAPAAAAGWRLATYDLRGHGDSTTVTDPADHTLDLHVDDLDAVVRATGGVAVGGVSLGGHVAVAWAVDRGRARAVVTCIPAWSGRAVPGTGPHAAVAAQVRSIGVAGMLASFETDTTMEPWLRHVLLRDWAAHDPDSLAAALIALDGALAPTEAELRRLRCPLGVVGWPDDPGHPLETARDWAHWAPRATLRTLGLGDLAGAPEALGTAAVGCLEELGCVVDPRSRGA